MNRSLNEECITWDELVGTGYYGNVYKALLGTSKEIVAVKVCKNPADRSKFLEEAKILQKLNHPHIISILDIRHDAFIMEFAQYGALKQYLLHNRSILKIDILLKFIYQLADALTYLSTKKFVHRDIAARNVLVYKSDVVKLGDFGLSRYLGNNEIYCSKAVRNLPIKWTSPESLNYRIFNSSSDVWMFGVCIWEILSLGKKPFENIPNAEFTERLEEGLRLEPPTINIPKLTILMNKCWNYVPKSRPSFEEILVSVCAIIEERKLIQTVEDDNTLFYGPMSDLQCHSSNDDYDFVDSKKSNTDVLEISDKENAHSNISQGNENILQQLLVKQQEESESDAMWLMQTENNFIRNLGSK